MPTVSVIIPCYNEQATIRLLLEALYQQTYPRHEIEVLVADGMSTDQTREEIDRFCKEFSDLQVLVIDNPRRTTPSGLNRAILAGRGEYIIRLDAHSVPYPDYIAVCVKNLQQGLGDNVGGVWQIQPGRSGWLGRAIAAAAAHPLGVGDAWYRYTGQAQAVDTVPFGAFRRETVDRIGGFDEALSTNEDYEFNVRLRQAGGKIWLDPAIRSRYYARGSLGALARQYWRYGFWKARMLRRYPHTLRWRQALPPLFVLGLATCALAAPWISPARWMLAVVVGIYLAALFLAGLQSAVARRDALLIIGIPLAIGVMHLSWGSAFLWSLIRSVFENYDRQARNQANNLRES